MWGKRKRKKNWRNIQISNCLIQTTNRMDKKEIGKDIQEIRKKQKDTWIQENQNRIIMQERKNKNEDVGKKGNKKERKNAYTKK